MPDADEVTPPAARPANSNFDGLVIVPFATLANLTLVAARVAHRTGIHYELRGAEDHYTINVACSAVRDLMADPILAKLLDDDLAGERYR